MSGWPIRIRLTAAFALMMALLLVGVAIATVLNVRASMNESIDNELQYRLRNLQAIATTDAPVLAQGGRDMAGQILDGNGHLLSTSPGTLLRPLLDPAEAATARSTPILIGKPGIGALTGPTRIAAGSAGKGRIVAAAISLAGRDATVANLRNELALTFPLMLLAATCGAYLLAGGVLRPVERMRARAATITAYDPDQLLPLPRATDEISRLGRTFNDLLTRLHAALHRERRFVADASHELRTPLGLLTTELELALRRPRTAPELTAALRSALDETDRLSRLANDLLLLSRSDDAGPRHTEHLELRPLLETVITRYRTRERTAALTLDVSAGLHVTANSDDLDRTISNLLDNALEYGRPPVTVEARPVAETGTDAVRITIRDHGPGIDPDFLPHAFDRFTRADPARGTGGAGLGLAITAALIHANGGTINATNHPGGGAEFTLTLPGPDQGDPGPTG